jgi:stress response protein YsnF
VRIIKLVREREVVVAVPRVHEDVTVDRVTLNRMVDAPVAVRQEGDTLIIPLLEEGVVMEKRLRAKEELRITTCRI